MKDSREHAMSFSDLISVVVHKSLCWICPSRPLTALCTYVRTYLYIYVRVRVSCIMVSWYAATPNICGQICMFTVSWYHDLLPNFIISSSCKMADQRVGMKRSHNVDDADSPETKKLNLQEGTYTLY